LINDKKIPPGQYYSNKWTIYASLGIPKIDIEKWNLEITGNIENEAKFTYKKLEDLSKNIIIEDFHCVTRWSIEKVKWEGIKLRDIINKSKPKKDSEYVMFHCNDGYTTIIPFSDAIEKKSILALKINDEELSTEQGFPIRAVIPQLYGWKSAKWLNKIEILTKYQDGFWELEEHGGYHNIGRVDNEERFKY